MSVDWTDARRDRLLSILTAVFALGYITAARGIENSLLSDEVGAGGVPQGVGIVMLVMAVALFAKSLRRGAPAGSVRTEPAEAPRQAPLTLLLRTAGLVAILAAYGLTLPVIGYPLAVSLLVLASGWLAGAALKGPLLLCAALAGPLLWLLFDLALKVRMPIGSLWS